MNVKYKFGEACRTERHEEGSIMAFPSIVEAVLTNCHTQEAMLKKWEEFAHTPPL